MKKEIKDTVEEKVMDIKAEEKDKRFTINVDSGSDEEGNKRLFSFSGPEKASLGLIYDAVDRIMLEVIAILQKRAENLRPKREDEIKKDIKSEDVGDKKEK